MADFCHLEFLKSIFGHVTVIPNLLFGDFAFRYGDETMFKMAATSAARGWSGRLTAAVVDAKSNKKLY